ncbi:sigma-E factor negative regulatory protein [Marinihelvus fidelis]|uniref:Sigma-E factor negative regulatory protein n=1 Tax=Marinihelvus fidelis TaxID=2613842 RepID=A0A5N0TJ08_9GAMM|nr:sigma-E factor negative regulatory protein [Marinihelvus fidelis]KAA9133279.1 sigma-E factor negative regulatory protein [Marinihelvus fidelis]
MNKDTLEHLSSLMDGEMSQDTAKFVARRMGSDPEMSTTWERYHLIRDCMRRQGGELALCRLTVDLDRVDAEMAAEAAAEQAPARRVPTWLKPASGFAIAASVAVMAVLLTVNGVTPGTTPATEPAQPFASPNPLGVMPESQPASFNGQAEARQRLNGYLLRHNRAAGTVGRQGFVSYVPMVTASTAQADQAEDGAAGEDAADTPVTGAVDSQTPQN